jgi:4-hydroxy-L-threonine phosphate dehydrogenase PdxA
LRRARRIEGAAFFVLGDSRVLKRFGFRPAANVRLVDCGGALPGVLPMAGLPTLEGAAASVAYLEEAVRLLRRKVCAGLVTAPVSKKNIEESGTPFSGHTEFLMRRFGDEEERHIAPAVRSLNRQMRGSFSGPWPADTVFHRACCGDFDLVMAMYHDQGLCAFKALDFSSGAQISVGLPFVRTSPVHGTAFDIAGKDIADAGSMETALRLAAELSRRSR